MFAWWGRMVYRYRYIVIAVMVALCLGGGLYSLDLGNHVTQSGFYDGGSQSVKASELADKAYGRDRSTHIVAIFTAPEGKTVEDPQWSQKIKDELNQAQAEHPDEILEWKGWLADTSADADENGSVTDDKKRTFIAMPLKGDGEKADDVILNNYKTIEPDLKQLDGGNVQLAGLQPLANELTGTIGEDQQRAEVLALPLVAVVLFFVFGGIVAASLPVMVGGLSIAGALGLMRLIAATGEPVHYFAQPVVTLIGLGIAIDYALFVVSRFREEIADGYDTETAVRRTMMTAGRTVTFSAVLIVASLAGLLLFPQGFLKSLTYAGIASVMLSAILSITVLPAALGVLGKNVDALGVRTLLRVPFFRNWKPTNWWLNFLADKTQKTQTREEVENGFWGKLINFVMKRPVLFAAPIIIGMILLIIPLGGLKLGGISERYLPPDNPVRLAQEDFDRTFPGLRTENLTLVIQDATPDDVTEINNKASRISGFTSPTWGVETPEGVQSARLRTSQADTSITNVTVLQNGLKERDTAPEMIKALREIQAPKGVTIWVGGTPALEQDSIQSLFDKLPLMLVILITTTTLLMFLAFGSLVLPIKAAVMSALTLGSTLGILTWIFVDGHFASALNFTPTPLTAPVIGLIIAVIYGLSTDYEVFLVSRMVEARERGMSTAEAIRIGTATTGRLITAAALILIVVAGAFVFSDLVMMKYLAFGLIAALLLDATVIRMFLVPSVMKLLGDDCWWAPRWMKRLQNRIGLGEIQLPDERKRPVVRDPEPALVGAGGPAGQTRPRDPTHPAVEGSPRPGAIRAAPRRIPPKPPQAPSGASTTRMASAGKKPPPHSAPPKKAPEAPTTRMPAPAKDVRAQRAAPRRADREIESWLGELRGQQPSAEPTRAPQDDGGSEQTTAIPAHRQTADPDSTEKLPKGSPESKKPDGPDKKPPRRGGGVSAADLLRREGRL